MNFPVSSFTARYSILPPQADRTIAESATLVVTNRAIDLEVPPENLSYVLLNAPDGAGIDGDGVITWTPSATQAPGTNAIITVVSDDGQPPLSATNSFLVFVRDTNATPVLPLQSDRTIDEQAPFIVTNAASENNVFPFNVSYQLTGSPVDATIDRNGIIRWTPSEDAGPGNYGITTIATDTDSLLTATNSFLVTVNEINTPPALPFLGNIVISAGQKFTVSNEAIDLDKPANGLTYQLLVSPTNASIDSNGLVTWVPPSDQVPSTNLFITVATDYNPFAVNAQHLSATNSFTVTILPPGMPPIIEAIAVSDGVAAITWSAIIGGTYRLQSKDDLSDTNWTDIVPDILATTNSASATNACGTSQTRFYRIYQVQ